MQYHSNGYFVKKYNKNLYGNIFKYFFNHYYFNNPHQKLRKKIFYIIIIF